MRGATTTERRWQLFTGDFNPRSSCEERQEVPVEFQDYASEISIHAPHARSDFTYIVPASAGVEISIHAPHTRSDLVVLAILYLHMIFQSTLLIRGATLPL